MIQVGDIVEYDAGAGLDRWEVISINDGTAQIVNCFGGTTFVDVLNIESIF